MTKTLKDFMEVYKPKSPDEQKFVDKHVTIKHQDRNGNGDDVFKGKTKYIKRKEERHGYDVGDDEKVYEESEQINEVHGAKTPRKGTVAYDIMMRRKKQYYKDPVIEPKDQMVGIAKVVAKEEVEDLDEVSKATMGRYINKAKDQIDAASWRSGYRQAKPNDPNSQAIINAKEKQLSKRHGGIELAVKKLTKEEAELEEKKLTPAEMKKREEVAKAIERGNPNMPMAKKMAIATATAKKVAESSDAYGQSMDIQKKKMITPSDTNKISKLAAMLKAEKKPVKEQAEDLEEKLSDEAKNVIRKTVGATGAKVKPLVKLAQMGKKHPIRPVDEAMGDITVKSKTSADSYAQHTGQDKKKTSVPKDPKTGKTLYQKVTEEEQIDEAEDYGIKQGSADYHKKMIKYHTKLTKMHAKSPYSGGANPYAVNKQKAEIHKKLLKNVNEEAEQIDEGSFASTMKKAIAAHERGDHKRAKYHLANAKTARYAIPSTQISKHKDLLNKYKELSALHEEEQIDESDGTGTYSWNAKHKKHTELVKAGFEHQTFRHKDGVMHTYWSPGYRHAALQKVLGEEAEQIDEISKELTRSYFNKALDSGVRAASRQWRPGSASDANAAAAIAKKRVKGLGMAKNRLAKEEVEQIDELSRATISRYSLKAKSIADNEGGKDRTKGRELAGRKNWGGSMKGVEKARVPSTNEEAEQIDELSKKTLGNYTYKAARALGTGGITAGLKIAADEPTEKNFKKMGNRQKGIANAVKRLTKEDIINRTIEKYIPEAEQLTDEERLIERLDGLSESHIHLLLSLFEGLNQDNRTRMLGLVETREGINSMIDFALDNRGE